MSVLFLCTLSFLNLGNAYVTPPDSPLVVGNKYWTEYNMIYSQKSGWTYKKRFTITVQLWTTCKESPYGGKYLDVYAVGLYTYAGLVAQRGVSVTTSGDYIICQNVGSGSAPTVVQIKASPIIYCNGATLNPVIILQLDIMGGHKLDVDINSLPGGWKISSSEVETEGLPYNVDTLDTLTSVWERSFQQQA